MHYKNGREAKVGDKVLDLSNGRTGILAHANAGSTTCNGQIVPDENQYYVTIGDCVHMDDAKAQFETPVESEAKA